jgi:glycosyltransferase involved in cell wall biosynthesis
MEQTPSIVNKPLVSICTPTFNRRPFIPYLAKCIQQQTYPLDRVEWIVVDDGTDPVEDILSNIDFVKVTYVRLLTKVPLGEKRNITHSHCTGDIFVYMDDDDYYPPERISHSVEALLANPDKLIAGTSMMNIYFKHNCKMYSFGPYGKDHATAATFSFRRELLDITQFEKDKAISEEKNFLKGYTIPIIQLDTTKTILVFSHIHNSFDKRILLEQVPLEQNPFIKETSIKPEDYIKDPELYSFYMERVNKELEMYDPGRIENKPDVLLGIANNKIKQYEITITEMNKKIGNMSFEIGKLRELNKILTERLRKMIDENIKKHQADWNPGR